MNKLKQIIAVFALIFPLLLIAQENDSEIREFNTFDKLVVSTNISVHLIPSTENKAIIEGKNLSNVTSKVKGGALRLSTKKPILKGEGIRVQLYYKTIRTITATTGSSISTQEKITGDKLEVSVNLGSDCDIEVDVNAVDISAAEGVTLNIKGKCDQLVASSTTGAKIQAKNLLAKSVSSKSSFGATITATASSEATLRAFTGGTIDIYGEPKLIESKTSTGGSINDHTTNAKKGNDI